MSSRLRAAVLLLIAGCALGACSSDLLHSTSWPTACDQDPATPGCSPGSADAADALPEVTEFGDGDESGDAVDGSADAGSDTPG